MSLFLPSGAVATTLREVASEWRHHFAKDSDHRIKMVTFENLANSTHGLRTDTREDKTQQHEAACDPVAQVEPCFLDIWVDEPSQVAGTIRSDKAIGVDPVPLEACRVAGKAYWCQLAEIAKQVVSCNQFLDAWKGVIMCGVPRKPGVL